MEKCFAVFPHNGKMFWDFSTLWKTFFHSVEKPMGGDFAHGERGPGVTGGR
jgi:hypothetical protein